nr:hypothetical protein Cry52Nrm1_p055 [Cryptomonas curvata]
MNLIRNEEKIIIKHYQLIFKNFIIRFIIEITMYFFIINNNLKYHLLLNSEKNLNFIDFEKITTIPKLVVFLILINVKDQLNIKDYIVLLKITNTLQKIIIIGVYKKFAKFVVNFALYKINKVEFFLKLNFKTNKKKNYFFNPLKKKNFDMNNQNKYLSFHYFLLNHKIKNMVGLKKKTKFTELVEIFSTISITTSTLKAKVKKDFLCKLKNKTGLIFSLKNILGLSHVKYFDFYSLLYIFFINYVNLIYFLINHQLIVYYKSFEILAKLGLQSIFNFTKILHTPFISISKKNVSIETFMSKQLLNYIIFKIENKIEKHSIYIWPIEKEQFESKNNLVLLKCGHLMIVNYFISQLNISIYKNKIIKNYIIKCPFCLSIINSLLKFIKLC